MSVVETVSIFVLIPLAAIVIIGGLAYGSSDKRTRARRYRPGRPYEFQPIWYLANPERVAPAIGPGAHAAQAPALESGFVENSAGERVLPGPTGGASDRW